MFDALNPEERHVAQHLRPPVPRHHLGRKPRAGARLRGRRLPAAHPADRGGHPALARPPPAGPVAFTTQRQEPDAVKILSGVFVRRATGAGHHRHADRADDRERRPALEGLFRDQGQVSPRPRRLHLRRQVRHPRLSRRRARVGARDGGARRGRRHRAQGRAAA